MKYKLLHIVFVDSYHNTMDDEDLEEMRALRGKSRKGFDLFIIVSYYLKVKIA